LPTNASKYLPTDRGTSLVEYAVILSLIGAASLSIVGKLGEAVSDTFDDGAIAMASAIPKPPPFDPDAFVLEVYTDEFKIIPRDGSTIQVNWGNADANASCGTSFSGNGAVICTYPSLGTYYIEITGDMPRYGYETTEHTNEDLRRVVQWGNTGLTSLNMAFRDAINLESVPSDLPASVTDLTNAFRSATNFNDPNVTRWNVSNVEIFGGLFAGAKAFDQPIGGWDMSKATSLAYMFDGSDSFNQDISTWDVSNVSDMRGVFRSAIAFDQDLSSWDTSRASSMAWMFWRALSFDSDISDWDVSQVKSIETMFGNTSFNHDISTWDVSSVENADGFLKVNSAFSYDLSSWDTSSLTSAAEMFWGASGFTSDLSGWCVSGISSRPSNFLTGSAMSGEPVWGTCP